MGSLVVDDPLGAEMERIMDPVEIRDRKGRVLGLFQPLTKAPLVLPSDQCPHTEDELRRSLEQSGGRSLADIWKSLGRS